MLERELAALPADAAGAFFHCHHPPACTRRRCPAAHLDGPEDLLRPLWAPRGRFDYSKVPGPLASQSCCPRGQQGFTRDANRARQRYLMGGQNANRCASFVSADTCFHGLFWPKIAELGEADFGVQILIHDNFTGISPRKDWCCQTGLNCRPLHYQWSARGLEISRPASHLVEL
jgi:hypothetical protein